MYNLRFARSLWLGLVMTAFVAATLASFSTDSRAACTAAGAAASTGSNVYFNGRGVRIASPNYLNCVQIKCPKGFANGTRCWRCREAK